MILVISLACCMFQDPVAADGWEGVRESTKPTKCPQINIEGIFTGKVEVEGDEDCLYLNVFTPNVRPETLLM